MIPSLSLIAFIILWASNFLIGYSFGNMEIKYYVYAAVLCFISIIMYLIHIMITNPDMSLSFSSGEWALTILILILFFGSSLGIGFICGFFDLFRKIREKIKRV